MPATAERLPIPNTAPPLPPRDALAVTPDPDLIDQRVLLFGVAWADYERLLALRGESAVPRLTYLDGELELMSPSVHHEVFKTCLARLVEDYARIRDIELEGYGSWTIRNRRRRRGAEPDECYSLGPLAATPERPDFVIEVVWTGGGIDKLAVWQGLGVPEVWVWKDGRLTFFALGARGYREAAQSRFLPDLDPRLLEECMAAPTQSAALRVLRGRLGPTGAA